jgi:hypothetical protein
MVNRCLVGEWPEFLKAPETGQFVWDSDDFMTTE